jgi:hypothetical protein
MVEQRSRGYRSDIGGQESGERVGRQCSCGHTLIIA